MNPNIDYYIKNIIIYQPTNEYTPQEQNYINDFPVYSDNILNFLNEDTGVKTNEEDYFISKINNFKNDNLLSLNNLTFEKIISNKKKMWKKNKKNKF